MIDQVCPCNPKNLYKNCCKPYHEGLKFAPTAETLMRSRYSAYVLKLKDYLIKTWHPSTCPQILDFEANLHWQRLEIISKSKGELFDDEAMVEFKACYKNSSADGFMHEKSSFKKSNNQWFYLSGLLDPK